MHALREIEVRKFLKPLAYGFGIFAITLITVVLIHSALFGPSDTLTARTEFLVEPDETLEEVAQELETKGLVRHGWVFQIAYALTRQEASVRSGGYILSPGMDAWTIAETLGQAPYLAWVVIPQGIRREQVAEELSKQLSWTRNERDAWLSAATAATSTLTEGVYFPDTYLIPSDQSPEQIAARLKARFYDEAEQYRQEASEQGMEWEDVITLASLIEREAAKNDKTLIAGILQNRLKRGMLLQVDATLQYALGNEEDGWWPLPTSEDKYIESPFNTYQEEGLPPAPIATPSLASINAALHPQKTTCLYYLHDSRGRIHCSVNYQGHVSNVNRYLR